MGVGGPVQLSSRKLIQERDPKLLVVIWSYDIRSELFARFCRLSSASRPAFCWSIAVSGGANFARPSRKYTPTPFNRPSISSEDRKSNNQLIGFPAAGTQQGTSDTPNDKTQSDNGMSSTFQDTVAPVPSQAFGGTTCMRASCGGCTNTASTCLAVGQIDQSHRRVV